MKRDKKYSNCTKCNCKKNETTNPWCSKCCRDNNAKKINCKCGNVKENIEHAVCNLCNYNYSKRNTRIKFIKKSKEICNNNKKIEDFVNKIQKRGGWCNMFEIFELIDVWEMINTNTIKYDNLSASRQIEKMWRDVKKVYEASKN